MTTLVQPVQYKPYNERSPSDEQLNLVRKIMAEGRRTRPQFQDDETRILILEKMTFDMSNGFPLTTMRALKKGFASAIGELTAFLNGARTLEQYVSFGGDPSWWKDWVTPEKCAIFGLEPGDFGKGSYGPSLTDRMKNGERFNQVEMLIAQMKDFPAAMTHLASTWFPEYNLGTKSEPREVVVAPCHGTMIHFYVFPEDGELQLGHVQRSGDVPVGVTFNIVQYAALGMMFAHLLGYTFTSYVHAISNGHIYGRQYPFVEELLSRTPNAYPTVTINTDVKSIFDFRPEHFTLEDYHPLAAMKIPTPI